MSIPLILFHSAAQLDIELPINFELTNPANTELNTHVGVLEFIADEGCVNLPQWVSLISLSFIRADTNASSRCRSWINYA